MALKKRRMKAEDIAAIKQITCCRISPDGSKIAYVVQTIDVAKKKNFSHLWMLNLKTRENRQFTYGDHADGTPVWSPDGKQFAFISNRGDESNVYVMRADGGEPRKVTSEEGGYSDLSWSPDGKSIAAIFCRRQYFPGQKAPEKGKGKSEKKPSKDDILCYRITRPFHKLNGAGLIPEARMQLYLIDAVRGRGKTLTSGVHDHYAATWSPDGKWIAAVTNRFENPDLKITRDQIFLFPAAGGEPKTLKKPDGPTSLLRFSPDGKWVAFIGNDKPDESWGGAHIHLWVAPTDEGEARDVAPDLDRVVGNSSIADFLGHAGSTPPSWSPDGTKILTFLSTEGNTHLVRIDFETGACETVIGGRKVVAEYDYCAETGDIVALISTPTEPGDLWLFAPDGESKRLTNVNRRFLNKAHVGEPEEVWFDSPHGGKVHGWIIKPYNYEEGKKYPVILQVHGGPYMQYANCFFHEFQFLAANGYVVFYANPRGSSGYGLDFSAALVNNWGEIDFPELMAGLDMLIQRPYADAERLGITGGSYGGFMTSYAIGHTDRFKAAVTQRQVSNLHGFCGADIGFAVKDEFNHEFPWENPENYLRMSPITYVKNIKTPALVIHSEQDLRCPVDQADQFFTALQVNGVESEYVRFPDESHELSRSGRPDRRVERLKRILAWFDKFLK